MEFAATICVLFIILKYIIYIKCDFGRICIFIVSFLVLNHWQIKKKRLNLKRNRDFINIENTDFNFLKDIVLMQFGLLLEIQSISLFSN